MARSAPGGDAHVHVAFARAAHVRAAAAGIGAYTGGLPEAEYEYLDPNEPYDPNMPVAPVLGQELVGDNPEMLTVIGRG